MKPIKIAKLHHISKEYIFISFISNDGHSRIFYQWGWLKYDPGKVISSVFLGGLFSEMRFEKGFYSTDSKSET